MGSWRGWDRNETLGEDGGLVKKVKAFGRLRIEMPFRVLNPVCIPRKMSF